MRGENALHHLLRPFRHQHVELCRRDAHLVADVRPVELIGFPAFRHNAAGIPHQRGERAQVQQLRPIGSGQRGLGGTPGVRNCLRANLLGRDALQVPELGGSGVVRAPVRRQHRDRIQLRGRQGFDGSFGIAVGHVLHHYRRPVGTRHPVDQLKQRRAQRRVHRRFRQDGLGAAHIQAHPVHLRRGHGPEAGCACGDHHLRHQVAPDQRLGLCRHKEILLRFSQPVGQPYQRAHQAPARVRRPARAK